MMPKEEIYIPPLTIKIIDHRNFGRKPLVGLHTIKSLNSYKVTQEKEEYFFQKINDSIIVNLDSSDVDESLNVIINKKNLTNKFGI